MKYKDNYESSQINVNILHKGLYSKNTNIKLRESHVDADQGYNLFEYLYDSNEQNKKKMKTKDAKEKKVVNLVELVKLEDDIQNYKNEISSTKLIVKLDVEGSEYEALLGMKSLFQHDIIAVQWEHHNKHKKKVPFLKKYIELLEQFGFCIFILGEENLLRIDDNYSDHYDIKVAKNGINVKKTGDYKIGKPKCMNYIALKTDVYLDLKKNKVYDFLD
jgi:FkbM family methyltransferase